MRIILALLLLTSGSVASAQSPGNTIRYDLPRLSLECGYTTDRAVDLPMTSRPYTPSRCEFRLYGVSNLSTEAAISKCRGLLEAAYANAKQAARERISESTRDQLLSFDESCSQLVAIAQQQSGAAGRGIGRR